MAKGDTYEVHEQILGRFVWHVWNADGELIAKWDDSRVVEEVNGEPAVTYQGEWFKTEAEAKAYVEKTYKATCKTVFSEA